ncbi:histone acetyltransferase [Saccharomycopsis crataegensis]|uniref:Chromatin modification-related protein n=1 Tax=Saccharomycopsis crataegensis TaxID=43959 RepID=A0AAV5QTY4_9ASCO|nr:histone acetyltransferase [Saccharomycopsis crataegensis]
MDPGSVLDQYTSALSNLPTELTFLLNELREKDLQFYEYRKKLQQYDGQIHKFIKQNGSLANNPKESQLYPKIRALFDECEKVQQEKVKLANTTLFLVMKHLTSLEVDIKSLEKDGLFQLIDEENMGFPTDTDYLDDATSIMTNDTKGGSVMVNGGQNNTTHKRTQSRKSTTTRHSMTSAVAAVRSNKRQKTDSMTPGALSSGGAGGDKRQGGDNLYHKVKTENDSISEMNYLASARSPSAAGHKRDNNDDTGVGESVTNTPTKNGDGEDQTLYCFCRQVSFGEMIACDNNKCRYEWFHYKCVGLTAEPTGKWYCPDCAKKMEKKKKKKN